jgi:hypothetical protein
MPFSHLRALRSPRLFRLIFPWILAKELSFM